MSIKQHLKPIAGVFASAGLALSLVACGGSGQAASSSNG